MSSLGYPFNENIIMVFVLFAFNVHRYEKKDEDGMDFMNSIIDF